ncbi:hypothetical protein [Bdellovibrio sp. BCCA]|uniref:hypothetical protein n=1 Tax=Bdellovibrio sp. BCCA TaxID=3136281 RepID=UPI0030F0EF4B
MTLRLFLSALLTLGSGFTWASSMDDEVPIIVREPAAEDARAIHPESRARVQSIIDNKTLKAISTFSDWYIGEIIALESQTPAAGIIGFVEVTGIENKQDGTYELTAELLRQSRLNFIQVGDQLMHLDLSSENEKYKGTTDLIVTQSGKNISSKYKPLFTQGVAVGETAQTLWQGEYMITWFGQVNYGLKKWLTVGTVVPADFLGAMNASAKMQVYESYSNVFAAGLTYAKIPNQTGSTLNLNVHWDSISSESVVSHTLLTVALFTFDEAQDATAIKSLGTSSFQTGYEFILDNWDRVLLGPSYNFEKKAVGGYLTYLKIWDKFHLSFSLNATDVASLKFSPVDGYYLLFDAYWRF